jgi:hypothetical protein
MQEHQRQQSQVFRLAGQKLAKRAPQPNRLRAKIATNQVFASRGRVAFIEDQVDDRLHRLQPLMQQIRRGNFIRNVRVANLLLRANQALRQRRLGRQKRPCDFRSCQSAERPQRQRHLRLAIQRGMATGENQAQPIVRISGRHLFRREVFFACIPFNFILERVLLFGVFRRRAKSISRRCATAVIHAPGFSGTPRSGQLASAAANASCIASSAKSNDPEIRMSEAIIRPLSSRNTFSAMALASTAKSEASREHAQLAITCARSHDLPGKHTRNIAEAPIASARRATRQSPARIALVAADRFSSARVIDAANLSMSQTKWNAEDVGPFESATGEFSG